MKLLTAFKICPDLDKLTQSDLTVEEEVHVPVYFLPTILNCYDESALELSLRLRDKEKDKGQTVALSAITVGNEQSILTLQTLQALGFQEAVHVKEAEEDLRFQPLRIASTLANYLKQHPQDLVLMGKEAPLGNSASVPQLVAHKSGYPLVCGVVDIVCIEENTVTVQIVDGNNTLEQRIALPCIVAVGNAVISKLRVPTLRDRLQCKNKELRSFSLEPMETKAPEPVLCALSVPNRSRESYISTESGVDALEDILAHSLKERLDTL